MFHLKRNSKWLYNIYVFFHCICLRNSILPIFFFILINFSLKRKFLMFRLGTSNVIGFIFSPIDCLIYWRNFLKSNFGTFGAVGFMYFKPINMALNNLPWVIFVSIIQWIAKSGIAWVLLPFFTLLGLR